MYGTFTTELSEDIKQHISQSASNVASETQQALSHEIKKILQEERQEIESKLISLWIQNTKMLQIKTKEHIGFLHNFLLK